MDLFFVGLCAGIAAGGLIGLGLGIKIEGCWWRRISALRQAQAERADDTIEGLREEAEKAKAKRAAALEKIDALLDELE